MDSEYLKKLEEENKALQVENYYLSTKLLKISMEFMELEKEFKLYRQKESSAEHDADYRIWRKTADDEINEKLRKLGI